MQGWATASFWTKDIPWYTLKQENDQNWAENFSDEWIKLFYTPNYISY